MPYIDPSSRAKINPDIDRLADSIAAEVINEGDETAYAGKLTYTITRLSLLVIKKIFGTKLKFFNIALLPGLMEIVKLEFYERIGAEAERDKRRLNGDVDVIEDFQEELELHW